MSVKNSAMTGSAPSGRCGIQSVEQGCVEGIGSCVRGEILRDMRESMWERDRWSGQELLIWRTAGGKRIGGGISERSDPPAWLWPSSVSSTLDLILPSMCSGEDSQ